MYTCTVLYNVGHPLGRGRAGQHRPGGRRGGRGVLPRGGLQHTALRGGQVDPGQCPEQRGHALPRLSVTVNH